MKTTRNTMRSRRFFYGDKPQDSSSGLSARMLSQFQSEAEIEAVEAELAAEERRGAITSEAAERMRRNLQTRREQLRRPNDIPPEGTLRVTNNCIISRISGYINIQFRRNPEQDVISTVEAQGFERYVGGFDDVPPEYRAPYSLRRYVFALDLCEGIERVESGLDANAVRSVIAAYLTDTKIGFDNLNDDLRNAIRSSQTIMIQTSPDTPPVAATGVEDIEDFYRIVDDVLMGHNVFLVGPAGTGKTYLAELVARQLGRDYVTLNCSQYTSPTDIKGGPGVEGYQEGALIDCWENGKILILDELPKIDPNTAGLLNEGLAKTKVPVGDVRAVIFNGKNEPKQKRDGFGVIATGNVFPTAESQAYTANTRQDLSLLDRFAGSVYFIGFNAAVEQQNAGSMLVWSVGMRIRQWILDNRVDSQLSIRWLQTAGSAYRLEMDRSRGVRQDSNLLDRGKTLKSHIDGMIATFNPGQQTALKTYLQYDRFFAQYQYRNPPYNEDTELYRG
jgi:hypothetical protein